MLSVFFALPLGPGRATADALPEIRVLLSRLNLGARADLTLSGRYLAVTADTEVLLPKGATLTVMARDGQMTLYTGGMSMRAGKELRLRRMNASDTTPAIRFNLQSGAYPGDLRLTLTDGVIRPILSLPLETYVQGVVPYEMDDSFPAEASMKTAWENPGWSSAMTGCRPATERCSPCR